MPYTLPNEADVLHALCAAPDAQDFNLVARSHDADDIGSIWGGAVTPLGTPAMAIQVAIGQVRTYGSVTPYFSATASVGITASTTMPRIDIIAIDHNSSLQILTGAPATIPAYPSIASTHVPLAIVFVNCGTTALSAGNIIDKRVLAGDRFAMLDDFVHRQITTTGVLGALGWVRSAGGTAADAWLNSESSHPGIWRLQSGASSGNNSRNYLGTVVGAGLLLANMISRFRFVTRIPTVTTVRGKVGLGENMSVSSGLSFGTSGVWFEFDTEASTLWKAMVRNAGTTTQFSSSVTYNANSWYQLDAVRLANGNWQFAINQSLVSTLSTNLPTSLMNFGGHVYTSTAAARSMDWDLVGLDLRSDVGSRW